MRNWSKVVQQQSTLLGMALLEKTATRWRHGVPAHFTHRGGMTASMPAALALSCTCRMCAKEC